jgi:hypothetical protein
METNYKKLYENMKEIAENLLILADEYSGGESETLKSLEKKMNKIIAKEK